jgi:hypothetical protein
LSSSNSKILAGMSESYFPHNRHRLIVSSFSTLFASLFEGQVVVTKGKEKTTMSSCSDNPEDALYPSKKQNDESQEGITGKSNVVLSIVRSSLEFARLIRMIFLFSF